MEYLKGMVLPVILKGGDNYLLWSRTTKAVLCGRGLWGCVTQAPSEEEKAALTLAEENKKFQEDQALLAILQSSLEVSVLEAYSYCETARELWETLTNVFGNVSNLTRVFEVKKAINSLNQGDMDFNKFFGKFRALWAELEMLRPATVDPTILNERREQDKVFALLLNLNPIFNDLIKHLLRADKLPSLEEVCAQVQKEQGSLGLFSGRSELPMAQKGIYKADERRGSVCDHCKRKGHTKDKCWLLHPHLRPTDLRPSSRFRESRHASRESPHASREYPRANISNASKTNMVASTHAQDDVVRKSDLEALIKSIASLKESGTTFFSHKSNRALVVDSGASHHMISNPDLLENIEPAVGNVIITNGDQIPAK